MKRFYICLLLLCSLNTLAENRLDGLWLGVYSHQDNVIGKAEVFSVVLTQEDKQISGKILEAIDKNRRQKTAVVAKVSGTIHDNQIELSKQWEEAGKTKEHMVFKLTAINANKLTGTWQIGEKTQGQAAFIRISSENLQWLLLFKD